MEGEYNKSRPISASVIMRKILETVEGQQLSTGGEWEGVVAQLDSGQGHFGKPKNI